MEAVDYFDFVVDDDGQPGKRLDDTLGGQPGCSTALARQLIAAGAVFVAGQRAARASLLVRPGQRIRAPRRLPKLSAIDWSTRILYRDEHWLAVNKAHGVPSAPTPRGVRGTLPDLLRQQLALPRCPTVVHRLDHDVSGVLLLALSATGSRRLTEAFTAGRVQKIYYGLVGGLPEPASGRIEQPIAPDPRRRGRMCIHPRGKPALTEYRNLASVDRFVGCAAVELRLHTGRTHQLRVHLASLGCPLLGDRWYGGLRNVCDEQGRVVPVPRLCLHAHRLIIASDQAAEPLQLQAPVPDFFA